MSELERLVDSVLTDELAAARRAPRAIGYVGCDIPVDLLVASGRFPCHLPWRVEPSTPVADRWLEDSFAPWTRSTLEDWAAGRFDFFDCVVFSRGEDNSQRLYYYICELQRRELVGGPPILIFDTAKIRRKSSIERSTLAVRRLAERLEIDARSLVAGIEATNQRRRLFTRLEAERSSPGTLYDRIGRASLFADIDQALGKFHALQDAQRRRVLLAGTAPPDERLHRAVEEAGWVVAGECYERSLQRLGPEIDGTARDPFAAVGRHVHALELGVRSFADRGTAIVAATRRVCADAVLLWLTEEDEALTWSLPAQVAALAAAGVPTYVATRRRWDCSDGIAEEFAEFLRGRNT